MFSDKFSQKVLKKDSNKDSNKDVKKDFKKDAGDLIQTVLIVSGVTVMCIVGLIPIGQSLANQAQEQNSCMSGSSNFVSSNFGNSCDGDGSGGSQLVITPGINDPYPVVVPTPTPTPTTTAPTTTAPEPTTTTPAPVEKLEITPVSPTNEARLTLDFRYFASAVKDYSSYTGGDIPRASATALRGLDFGANLSLYPQNSPLNLEYCASADRAQYVLSTYLGNNKVMYITRRMTTPDIYTLDSAPGINDSLCQTSADKAGLDKTMGSPITGISSNNVASAWVKGNNGNASL